MTRKYDILCPVAGTLDIIGERWTLLILRDFFLHKKRKFGDFEQGLPGLTPAVLSARLKELETNGIIKSALYSEHPPRLEYSLTPKGSDLGKVLLALKSWGEKYLDC